MESAGCGNFEFITRFHGLVLILKKSLVNEVALLSPNAFNTFEIYVGHAPRK